MPHEHPVQRDQVEKARQAVLDASESEQLAELLRLIADPVRVRILDALRVVPELCVGDLALALDASEDSVGYALKLLRTAGLVRSRRDGRMQFYRLAQGFPEPLFAHCLRVLGALPLAPGVKEDH
jgi:ArsR family transcriptional regulator, lead/cadmium/zinc/bismuth-responsive transcriptional repressor